MVKRSLLALGFLVAWAPSASAEPRQFREPSVPALVGFGALGAWAIGAELFVPPRSEPSWTMTLGIDDEGRHLLRASSPEGRAGAALASDVLLLGFVALPLADAMSRDSGEARLRTALVDLEALALTGAIVGSLKLATARARPYTLDGGEHSGDAFKSFPSGHTAFSFTGASLFCTQRGLATWADSLACSGALAGAATTGILRIVADKHHATDVLAGAAIGGLAGWLVPTLQTTKGSDAQASTAPLVWGTPTGFVVSGRF